MNDLYPMRLQPTCRQGTFEFYFYYRKDLAPVTIAFNSLQANTCCIPCEDAIKVHHAMVAITTYFEISERRWVELNSDVLHKHANTTFPSWHQCTISHILGHIRLIDCHPNNGQFLESDFGVEKGHIVRKHTITINTPGRVMEQMYYLIQYTSTV